MPFYISSYEQMCKTQVKEIMENNGDLTRDLFLCEHDICNLVVKLAK